MLTYLMETVRYMEVTRAQLPIGSETLNSGPSSAASGPSNSDCHTTQYIKQDLSEEILLCIYLHFYSIHIWQG